MSPEGELSRLYDAHATALLAFARSLTRDDTDARDLLQDTFVKIARNPALLSEVRDERGFLLRLVHNAAIDLFRRHATRARVLEPLPDSEPPPVFAPAVDDRDEEALRIALAAALRRLPPEQRSVVHLKLWEGLTFEAIADLLEIPPNTAASRYRYGVDKLRGLLRPLYEELR